MYSWKRFILAFWSMVWFGCSLLAQPDNGMGENVVFVVDSLTYKQTGSSIEKYKNSVENDGLNVIIAVQKWRNPNSVKKFLKDQYITNKIAGAVFIGDIPIAMLRGAQHLTSAFKIKENSTRFSWPRTSVPSDRFYDDFDLQFRYIRQDTLNPQMHYYRLKPDSPQKINSEIYSGRMALYGPDSLKYQRLGNYLQRIARQKEQGLRLDNAFIYTGHGYHSESLDAWNSNCERYREQFPNLQKPGKRLRFFNHAMDGNMKYNIIHYLQQPSMDLAVFHAHGSANKQYLLGFEPAQSIMENIESVKLFLRSKMRRAKKRDKSPAETQIKYMKRYGLPFAWFEDALSDSLAHRDSLLFASQDMFLYDIQNINPQAKLIYFDECFNGAFFNDGYVAGEYVFKGAGKTVTALANSVNVLQDVWANRYFGLIPMGLRAGEWLKLQNKLELHVIGDPTFRFGPKQPIESTVPGEQLFNKDMLDRWLEKEPAALQLLGIRKLYETEQEDALDVLEA
ncbi:MAG: hypothetical protein GF313_08105, partial [Caldithrix sp.]|nr:hypothetical protein [Caldithrix sp.]